jgi:hypothetical protein
MARISATQSDQTGQSLARVEGLCRGRVWPEADFLADSLRQLKERPAVFGKDAAMLDKDTTVVKQNGFDSCEAFRVKPLQIDDLRLKGSVIPYHECMGLDERGHRLVEFVQFSVVLVPRPGHSDAPMRVPLCYPA